MFILRKYLFAQVSVINSISKICQKLKSFLARSWRHIITRDSCGLDDSLHRVAPSSTKSKKREFRSSTSRVNFRTVQGSPLHGDVHLRRGRLFQLHDHFSIFHRQTYQRSEFAKQRGVFLHESDRHWYFLKSTKKILIFRKYCFKNRLWNSLRSKNNKHLRNDGLVTCFVRNYGTLHQFFNWW